VTPQEAGATGAMPCGEVKRLLPLHRLDLLEPREAVAITEHLQGGCGPCSADAVVYDEALSLLPLAIPAEEPSPVVKTRLMARIRRAAGERSEGSRPSEARAPARSPQASPSPSWALTVAVAAVAAVLSGAAVWFVGAGGSRAGTEATKRQIEGLEEKNRAVSEEIAGLRSGAGEARETIRRLTSIGTEVIDLEPQGAFRRGGVRLFHDRERSLWTAYATSLPPAGPGRTYQIWFITPTTRVSAGTFQSTADGAGSISFPTPPDLRSIVAVAITDEPEGGSLQPTGAMLLLGKV